VRKVTSTSFPRHASADRRSERKERVVENALSIPS
jgi:hypothetical protein